MLSYLEKYNNLPTEVKEKISAPDVLASIKDIETKYGVSLATIIMRIMVGEISIVDLPKFFVFEHGLEGRDAERMVDDLKEKVFYSVANYLGFEPKVEAVPKAEIINEDSLSNWLQAKKDDAAVRSSNFFFSTEDEEEVKQLAKKMETFVEEKPKAANEEKENKFGGEELIEKKLDLIQKRVNISFSSSDLNSRVRQILKTYLKGIRNKIDTKQTLIKTVDAGGLGMNEIFADNVLLVTDKINSEEITIEIQSSQEKIVPPAPAALKITADDKPQMGAFPAARDFDYNFNDLIAKKQNEEEPKEKIVMNNEAAEINESGKEPAAPPVLKIEPAAPISEKPALQPETVIDNIKPLTIDLKSDVEKPEAKSPEEKEDVIDLSSFSMKQNSKSEPTPPLTAPVKPSEIPVPHATNENKPFRPPISMVTARQRAQVDGRIKVQDVKYVPKLTGPIDELRELDLVNFRRFSANASVAAEKIKEKISILEGDGYAHRLEGIKAWRQSSLNKLYLEIGNESIASKRSINSVIEDRKQAGKDYLSAQEFDAIMDLNKEIRY